MLLVPSWCIYVTDFKYMTLVIYCTRCSDSSPCLWYCDCLLCWPVLVSWILPPAIYSSLFNWLTDVCVFSGWQFLPNEFLPLLELLLNRILLQSVSWQIASPPHRCSEFAESLPSSHSSRVLPRRSGETHERNRGTSSETNPGNWSTCRYLSSGITCTTSHGYFQEL